MVQQIQMWLPIWFLFWSVFWCSVSVVSCCCRKDDFGKL